jgi:predicted DNA-binding protein
MDRTPASYFERLVASAERIARHSAYPGKQQAVDHCVEDVEDLIASGRITAEQGEILLNILSGACLQMA